MKEAGVTKVAPPAGVRIATVVSGSGRQVLGSAVDGVLAKFSSPESGEIFMKWREDPITCLFIAAIRELGLKPDIAGVGVMDPAVGYGMSQMAGLASELMDDPSSLFPGLFRGSTPGGDEDLVMDYRGSPYDPNGSIEDNNGE